MNANRPLNVAFLALPEVTASTLHGMFDLFSSAGRDWAYLTGGRVNEGAAKPYIVARSKEPLAAYNGVMIMPHHALDDCPPPDILCVSDFFIPPEQALRIPAPGAAGMRIRLALARRRPRVFALR